MNKKNGQFFDKRVTQLPINFDFSRVKNPMHKMEQY